MERDNAVARLQAMIQGRGRFGGATTSSSSTSRASGGSGGGSSSANVFQFEEEEGGGKVPRLGAVSAASVAGAAKDLEFFFDELYGRHRFQSVDDYGDQMD